MAKTGTGPCEQIRVLLAWRRSAMKARVAAHRQITALLTTAPDAVRPRFARLSGGELIGALARTRPAPATDTPASATARALRRLARRHRILTDEIADIDTELRALTARAAPTMLATKALRRQPPPPCSSPPATTPAESAPRPPSPPCAAPPRSPPAPGKTNRHRLNRGGDRQANWALHQIALVRLSSDPRTKAYAARLTATGKNCKEILRCLKRAIAREAWHLLTHPQPAPRTDDLRRLRHERGLTLTQAAHHLNTHPARISELERGTRPDTTLTAAYRQWLNTQQPQTHTA